ncbi:MAG: ATP-binding protein [Clostridia bacterium]|nr:ATP-binding protein [Clostridia bacterium]
MGYSRDNLRRIREMYQEKSASADDSALKRKYELWEKLPEIKELDSTLADIGHAAVIATISGGENASEKVKEFGRQSLELQDVRKKLLQANGYPADYTEPHYECKICRDTGYADGKMCSCMKRALVLLGYESSGLGKLMQSQSFETFSLDFYRQNPQEYEKMSRNFEAVKDFAENFSSDRCLNLALFGGTGLGKTHLSTAAAKTVIDRGYDVLYVTSMGLISDFEKERFGSGYSDTDAGGLARYYECDLLIVDDLGTEIKNQFTVSVIYNVINTRLSKKKSTMISTNLTLSELKERYWDRIASRIFGEYQPLIFVGTDVRKQKLLKK